MSFATVTLTSRAAALLTAVAFAVVPAAVAPDASAAAPSFSVTPATGNFGKVTLTNTAIKTFRVKNTSKVDLMFEVRDFSNPYYFGQVLPTDGVGHCMVDAGTETHYWGVAPGGTCDFQVEFVPHTDGNWRETYPVKSSYVVSAFSAALADDYVHGPAGPLLASRTLKLTGKGVTPKIKVVPGTVNFGTVDTNGAGVMTAQVVNKSDIGLVIREQNYAGTEPFRFIYVPSTVSDGQCQTSDDLYWSIDPGDSCTVRVLVSSPTGGNHSAKLQLQVLRPAWTGYNPLPASAVLRLGGVKVKVHGSGHPG